VKFRVHLILSLALLLAISPVLGLFPGEAKAASGTRVAVIQSLKGTVTVKKAGGAKEFQAFAKMSLNEGDVLKTGKDSSVVLQFANGTSEDDRMTVAANTTLTFSKLSDKSGTRTKVSMWNGSAWVDVKSIASPNDEFTLETPTAVMGVRGTHLLVSVDPVTGATRLTVVAGVVNAQPTGNGEARDVKPGDNALVVKEEDKGEVIIAPADLNLLMQQSDSTIVEAIVAAAAEIAAENRDKLDQYLEGAEEASDLDRMRSNIESLLGAIVESAIRNGVITEERASELIAEAETRAGVQVDLTKKTLTLTEAEKQRQEEQRKRQEELRSQREEERQAKEAERRRNEALLRDLENSRRAKEEANRQAEEERRQRAETGYLSQLSEEERQRYEQDRNQLGDAGQTSEETQSPTGGSGSGGNNGGNNGGSQPPAVFPDFLSGWESTAGSNQILWHEFSLEDMTAYGLNLPQKVPSMQLTLQFDDTSYTIQAFRVYESMSTAAVTESPPVPPIAQWTASGTFKTLTLSEGLNFIALVPVPKGTLDMQPEPAETPAMLVIHNGEPAGDFYVNEQKKAGKIGPDSYLVAIPDPSESVKIGHYFSELFFDVVVTGDNGTEVEPDEYGHQIIRWNSSLKQSRVTHLSVDVYNVFTGIRQKSYTLTLTEDNGMASSSALWKIDLLADGSLHSSMNYEFDEYENIFFTFADTPVTALKLEPLTTQRDDYNYEAYLDGEPLQINNYVIQVPVAEGANEVAVVVRPKDEAESSRAAVFVFYVWKQMPYEVLENVILDGESVFDPYYGQSVAVVPPGEDTVALSIQTNLNAGNWKLFDVQAEQIVEPDSLYHYTLTLQDEWNWFVLFTEENSQMYPVGIYYGQPLHMNALEFRFLDENTQDVLLSWDAFDPDEEHFSIEFDGTEQQLPDEVTLHYEFEPQAGFFYDYVLKVKSSGDWTELSTDSFHLPPGVTEVKLLVRTYAYATEALVYERIYSFNITRIEEDESTSGPELIESLLVLDSGLEELEASWVSARMINETLGEIEHTYRVLADPNDFFVFLDLDFMDAVNSVEAWNDQQVEWLPIFEDTNIGRLVYNIQLSPTPYTVVYVRYNTGDQWEALRVVIARETSPPLDMSIDEFELLNAESWLPSLMAGEDRIYALVSPTEIDGSEVIAYAHTASKPFTDYTVLGDDGKVMPYTEGWGYTLELEEGWNELEIVVRDVAHLLQPRTYTLTIWYGDEAPEGFDSFTVVTVPNQLSVGQPYYDPMLYYVDLEPYMESVRFRPISMNADFAVESVYAADGTELMPDQDGYYFIGMEDANPEGEVLVTAVLLSSSGRTFAYQIGFVPKMEANALMHVEVTDTTNYPFTELGNAYFSGDSAHFQLTSGNKDFWLRPVIRNDHEAWRVLINEEEVYLDDDGREKALVENYKPGSSAPVLIQIISASGNHVQNYYLHLTDQPVLCSEEILPGLDCAAGYYNGSIPVNWVLDEVSYHSDPVYGTQLRKVYFAQLPADLNAMTVEFQLDLSILDAKLVKGEATVIEAVYSNTPYSLPLEEGENYFSLYYSDGADTYYFFDFYIQAGPFITALWTSNEEEFVQTSDREFEVAVGSESVEVIFWPFYYHFSLYMNAYPMDSEMDAWIGEDGRLYIEGLKYGKNNIIRLEAEDPAGGLHDYFLYIWYGLA